MTKISALTKLRSRTLDSMSEEEIVYAAVKIVMEKTGVTKKHLTEMRGKVALLRPFFILLRLIVEADDKGYGIKDIIPEPPPSDEGGSIY